MSIRTVDPAAARHRWMAWLSRSAKWLILLLLSLGVLWLLLVLSGYFHQKISTTDHLPDHVLPKNVRLVPVERIRNTRHETAVGTIKPVHEAKVAAKILARVLEVKVVAGQTVMEGEVLVRLSDEELIARLRQAEAEKDAAEAHLQQAKSEAKRATQLLPKQAISQAEHDIAQTSVLTTQAQVELAARRIDEAKILLGYATIVAPFSGIVIEKVIEPGDTVSPGQPLLMLYDPTQMQLVANVRESLAMKLKVGQTVQTKLEALNYEGMATVREVVPRSDVSSRSFEVKVSGACPPEVYSGMFGRLILPLEEEELLVIPKESIERVGQLTLVNVVSGQQLQRRSTRLGREFGDRMEVLAGLREGEQVAVRDPGNNEGRE